MGYQDDLLKRLLKEQSGFKEMQRQILESQQYAYKALLNDHAFSASKAMGSLLSEMHEQNRKHLEIIGRSLLADFSLIGVSSHFAETIRQSLAQSSLGIGVSAVQALAEAAKSISQFRVDTMADIIARVHGDIDRWHGVAGSAAIAAIGSAQLGILDSVRSSFARSMADALRTAFEVSKEDEAAFEPVQQLIEDKVATLPHNQVTAEGLWRIFIDILVALLAIGQFGIALYQVKDARQTANTQSAQFNHLVSVLQRIAANTEQLIPEQDENIYYVVERRVNLKLKPHNRSLTIVTLSPNQKVRLERMNHKWIYIEYFDYLDGVPRYGWADKKYLKRL
jgi:hypothetical protein